MRKRRSRLEKVDKVVEEIIAGNTDPLVYRSLNPAELSLFERMVDDMRHGNEPADEPHIIRLDYVKEPVGIKQFIEDDYYLGEVHRHTEENEGMWPEWKRLLIRDFNIDSKIHNLVITGSLGIGKTSMMVTLLLYRLYIATCLRNPQNFFGLSRGSRIVYVMLSVTKEQIKDTAFGDAMNYMGQSAYFREVCKFDPEQQYSGYVIPIRNTLQSGRGSNLLLRAGSKGQHALGRNVPGVGMDEGNFRLEKDPDLKAYELYDTVRTRISNRFQKVAGFLPALSVIASSASDESSFTEKVIKEIQEANSPQTQLVYRHAIYKIKRHSLTLLNWWFKVSYGLRNIDPVILEGLYSEDGSEVPVGEVRHKDTGEPISCTLHEEPANGAQSELVPGDYYEAFRRNCRAQLQNLSGISIGGSHRLFSSMVDVEWCITEAEREGVPNPLQRGASFLPISSEDTKHVWDYLDHPKFLTLVSSKVQPIRHPTHMRYAHLDLATQTKCGVSVCHLVGNRMVTGLIKDGTPFSEYRLVVEYDFVLTIIAGRNKPINLEKVQRFFLWLRDMCGYRFGKITADQYQCLTGDTLVNTDRGILELKDVKVGYHVSTRAGEAKPVLKTYRYAYAPVVKITTNRGEVICGTPIHRIQAASSTKRLDQVAFDWMQMGDLKIGDWVQMADKPVAVDGVDLAFTPFEPSAHPHPASALHAWRPPERMTPKLARWIGLMWGDGSWNSDGALRLTAHTTEVDCASTVFRDTFAVNARTRPCKGEKCSTVSVNSRAVAVWLTANGLNKPAAAEFGLPAHVLHGSRKTKQAFLQGLFSTDGSVSTNGDITLSTCQRAVAKQVQVILRTDFGIRSTLITTDRVGFGNLHRQYVIRVGGSRAAFAEHIGFCYKTKAKALASVLHQKGRNLGSKIVNIEYARADVYDIEVEGDHSYIANGFVSHNSDMPLQMLEGAGFKTDKLSLDRDKTVYSAWRAGFEEHRIRIQRNPEMLREAEQLLEMDKKFDHPPGEGYSKDTTDASAGAFFNAVNSEEKITLTSYNAPAVYTGRESLKAEQHTVPITIPLPLSGYDRSKVFVG